MYWLNVDKPDLACTLHRENCSSWPENKPKYKGFGELKRDGGWFSFKTVTDADSFYRDSWKYQGYRWVRCSLCKA